MPTIGADSTRQGCADQILESERLVLGTPVVADLAEIVAIAGDWDVARYTVNIPHPYGPDDAAGWIAQTAAGRVAGTQHAFTCRRRDDGALVGTTGLRINRDEDVGVLGYMLGRAYWGQGYASEAVRCILRYAFEQLSLGTVRGDCVPENRASARVMERVGMNYVGREGAPVPARNGATAVEVRSIARGDWLRDHALPIVQVSAAALLDADDRVLLAQRPAGRPMAGLWEFPGGKVLPGETPEAAVIRELREELGIDTVGSCLAPLAFASHRYADFHLLMPLFVCRVWHGEPLPREGQHLAWVRPARLADYPMPPADLPLVAMLRDLL